MAEKRNGGGIEAMRRAIMVVTTIVVIGYFLMWILMPTNTYRDHWYPKIYAHTNSTFIGTQGEATLIYTFPILFLSILGCIYLHLGMKGAGPQIERKGHGNLASWKRPIVIKGLGIVTWIELTFIFMFIALLLWTFFNYMHILANIKEFQATRVQNIWEARLERVALVLGIVGNVCLTFLFFPVSRGSSVLPLLGLTYEGCIKYHIWLGHITLANFATHGLLYIIYWISTNQPSKMLEWRNTHVSNVAGELAFSFGLMLWVTTYPRIRRTMFELFFYTHYFYVLFIFFFVLHLGISYACIMLPGFYLFVVDRYLRMLQSRHNVALVSARVLPSQTVELNFSKTPGLSYNPTSIIFINVPSISKLQWHPFTISSSSNMDPEVLSVVIKGEGTWTKNLNQILGSTPSIDRINISVEGPYGPSSTQFLQHDALVMVSGGSGVSPFISIIRDFIYKNLKLKQQTPKLFLISAFKNSFDLTMLDLIIPVSDNTYSYLSSTLELEIEAYVTRETETEHAPERPLPRTMWFKPSGMDAPISPILGRNGWLWLGAIIAFSFIIYLLFMGILNRYYIYPIDHNTNRIYSSSSKAVLNMVLICMSIIMAASAAFLWNKKQIAIEAEKSRDSGLDVSERDVESIPCQSLVQSTKIQYGQRPDLKRIILERKESRVGVLVCGPKQMRHEVANICSSRSVENLHFESISFTW